MLARVAPFAFILLWSSSFLTARVGLVDVSPLLFVGLRLVLAAGALVVLMLLSRQSWTPLRGRWHHLALAGALVNGVTLGTFHVGMVTVNAAVMALVQALNPMVIALLAGPVLGERMTRRQWTGLALGAIGVALVVAPRALESRTELTAILLGFVGTLGLSLGTIYFGRHGRGVPLLPATTVQLLAAAVLVILSMLVFEQPRVDWTFAAIGTIGWNVAAVSIGGMALYYFMLNRGTAGRVAANFYLIPGVVAVACWLLLGEALSPLTLFGLAAASAGVWLVARR